MSTEANKAVVRRFFEEYINGNQQQAFDELVADDIVTHTPIPGIGPGRDAFLAFTHVYKGALPNQQHTTIHDLLAEGDKVVCRHTHWGVHDGELMGVPPTGKEITVPGIEIFRIANGQIAEFWHQDDLLSLMQQLGVAG